MTPDADSKDNDDSKSLLALAINAGSSSLKAALIDKSGTRVASFLGERFSTNKALVHVTYKDKTRQEYIPNGDHTHALEQVIDFLKQHNLLDNLVATGHRVVHGGTKFAESVQVDDGVLDEIESQSHLAPLHNPLNLKGMEAIQQTLPSLPMVAVFDTSFHTTLPSKASTYPIPKTYRDRGIQKYGFHGTSVRYVVHKAMEILPKMKDRDGYNMIVCHLGNGASVTAVAGGKSVETSMGFSPLDGLMMGTRSGDIDPAVIYFAVHSLDISVDQVLHDLNKESGLKAMVDSHDPDMRAILQGASDGKEDARLAVEMFTYRVAQHIAKSLVALPGPAHAIIFTGGIGEHSPKIRHRCVQYLKQTILPGLSLDDNRNQDGGTEAEGVLTAEGAFPACILVPTDEEAMIAKDCFEIVVKQ